MYCQLSSQNTVVQVFTALQTFGKLQSKLFPPYFALLSAANAICLSTIAFAPGSSLPKGQAIALGEPCLNPHKILHLSPKASWVANVLHHMCRASHVYCITFCCMTFIRICNYLGIVGHCKMSPTQNSRVFSFVQTYASELQCLHWLQKQAHSGQAVKDWHAVHVQA